MVMLSMRLHGLVRIDWRMGRSAQGRISACATNTIFELHDMSHSPLLSCTSGMEKL